MNNTYDLLFADLEGTQMYAEFLKKHIQGTKIIEFACGTADLLHILNQDYDVLGVDIDETMLEKAIVKYPELKDKIVKGSFLDFSSKTSYDTLVCVGDSLNYMESLEEMDAFVETAAKLSQTIIVDVHHPYRLIEFEEPYYEEGRLKEFDYAYQIECDQDRLVHTINYLNGQIEQVHQWVFDPFELINRFSDYDYEVEIYTDFDISGILEEGEKIMLIFSKGTV